MNIITCALCGIRDFASRSLEDMYVRLDRLRGALLLSQQEAEAHQARSPLAQSVHHIVELRSLYSTAQMVIDKQYENEEAIGINAGDKMSLPNMPLVPPQDEAGLQQENEKMSLILNEARKFIAAQNQVMKDTILSDAMLLYPCIATSRR